MLICPWLPNFSASPQFCCWTSHKKCHYIHYIKNLQLWRLKPPTTLFGFVWKYCTAKLVLHGLLSLTPMKFAVLGFREPSDSWVHSHSIWFVPTLFMNHQVLSHVQRPVLHAMTPFFAIFRHDTRPSPGFLDMQSLWWDGPEHFFMEKPWAKMDKQQLFFLETDPCSCSCSCCCCCCCWFSYSHMAR